MIWQVVFGLVQDGTIGPAEFALLAKAVTAAVADVESGRQPDPIKAMLAHAPEVMPLLETIANAIQPGAGVAIAAIAFGLSFSHTMTPAEAAAWFARASGIPDGGAP